jgi:hypothetical protein
LHIYILYIYIYTVCIFNLVQVQLILIKYHVHLAIGAVQQMYMKARAHVQPAIVYFGAHTTRGHVEILDVHVWSAYAAILRRLSTKCFTKLHRGFRILAFVLWSRRLEPNVWQKSDLEARARRQKRRGCDHKSTIDELTPCGRRKTSRQSHFPLNNSSGCDGIRPPSVMRFCVTEE